MSETTPHTAPNSPRHPGAPWPVPEAARFLAVSERHLRRLIEAGKVHSIRMGRRRLIPAAEVARLASTGC